jgi:hypothetical protein
VSRPEVARELRARAGDQRSPARDAVAKNARQYAVGAVGENVPQGRQITSPRRSRSDDATIAKMDNGKRSCLAATTAISTRRPAFRPNGERYDAIQKNIVGNHLAIVDRGRAGSARVRMDAA